MYTRIGLRLCVETINQTIFHSKFAVQIMQSRLQMCVCICMYIHMYESILALINLFNYSFALDFI